MTLRMNDMGLEKEGYKKVARYVTFERCVRSWDVWTYTCWKKSDTECIVRTTNNRGFHWLHFFDSRMKANEYINKSLGGKSWKREL